MILPLTRRNGQPQRRHGQELHRQVRRTGPAHGGCRVVDRIVAQLADVDQALTPYRVGGELPNPPRSRLGRVNPTLCASANWGRSTTLYHALVIETLPIA